MGVSKRLADAIMKLMPQHAELYITETEFGGAVLSIHWKLNTDENRPNKYSKTIVIRLTRELLEDFPNYKEPMQEDAVKRLENWVGIQLKSFEPDHNSSRFEYPPTVEWTINSGILG